MDGRSGDRRWLGWLLAGGGMLSVSTDSLWVRVSEAESINVAFWVACSALPVYAAISPRMGSSEEPLRRYLWPLLAVGLVGGASQIFFFTAITQTRVSNVVAIVATAPLLAAGCARLFLGERITRQVGIAIAVTLVGIAVIVSSSLGKPTLKGDLLAFAAVLAFSINMNVWRRFPDMNRLVGLSISAVMVIAATAFFASPFSLDLRAYLAIGAMGLLFNPLGRLALSSAPRFAPVSEVALFTPIETVAGTAWAALFLGELPRSTTVVGAVVVLVGVLYGTVGTNPAKAST